MQRWTPDRRTHTRRGPTVVQCGMNLWSDHAQHRKRKRKEEKEERKRFRHSRKEKDDDTFERDAIWCHRENLKMQLKLVGCFSR